MGSDRKSKKRRPSRSRSRSRSRDRKKRSRSESRSRTKKRSRRYRSREKKKKHHSRSRSRSMSRGRRKRSRSRSRTRRKRSRSRSSNDRQKSASRSRSKSKSSPEPNKNSEDAKVESTEAGEGIASQQAKEESAGIAVLNDQQAAVAAMAAVAEMAIQQQMSPEEREIFERRERVRLQQMLKAKAEEEEEKAREKERAKTQSTNKVDLSTISEEFREMHNLNDPSVKKLDMGTFKTPQELRKMWEEEAKRKEEEESNKKTCESQVSAKSEAVLANVEPNKGFTAVSVQASSSKAPKIGQLMSLKPTKKVGGFSFSSLSSKKPMFGSGLKKSVAVVRKPFGIFQTDDKAPTSTNTVDSKKIADEASSTNEASVVKQEEESAAAKAETAGKMDVDEEGGRATDSTTVKVEGAATDNAGDALDAYMSDLSSQMTVSEKNGLQGIEAGGNGVASGLPHDPTAGTERFYGDDEKYSDDDFEEMAEVTGTWLEKQKQKGKGKELKQVDHAKMNYLEFRKNFYIESPEIAQMTEEEVKAYREKELEGVKLRGKGCPNPIKKWIHCGLSSKMYKVLEREGLTNPFPIQAQAIPAIMSGRDVIACAKTGSGKTLAFVVPMMRHIMDQPPLESMDGPIAIIMCPTRELAIQIHLEIKKFAKPLGLRNVAVYGGAGVAAQIADLKRGAEIITCTPGRMIDILCANSGRVTNLTRCTYCVLDEADRMFDMGFAPQIMTIIDNMRPDRQTVMFSATFPRSVEMLAKKALTNPVEIIIGGRSTASGNVKQLIEVRDENTKFRRLLELLGKWYSTGNNILVFMDQQEAVDNLFRQLIDAGYPCLALHGGMDQSDRDFTIADFKSKLRTLMVATSVVARGLDVKDLVLVVNYTVPNHYEDYVHRVGRTGRAGKKGTAITFISPSEERFAPDLVKALTASKQTIPQDLQQLADAFLEKRKKGEVKYGSNDGFASSKGFKFDEEEDMEAKGKNLALRAGYLPEDEEASAAAQAQLEKEKEKAEAKQQAAEEKRLANSGESGGASASGAGGLDPLKAQLAKAKAAAAAAAQAIASSVSTSGQLSGDSQDGSKDPSVPLTAAEVTQQGSAAARAFAVALSIKAELSKKTATAQAAMNNPDYHSAEVEINDYPQHSRWKVTHKKTIDAVTDMTDVSITTKGMWVPPGRKPQEGERKLYLLIEGKTEVAVKMARQELVRILEEAALEAKPEKDMYGKYSVLV